MSSALEEAKPIEINQWLTLATAPSPTKLLPGQSPYAYNTWVDEKPGSVITANGFIKVGTLPSGNPGTFCINYFKTAAGTQTFVVSDNATVWTTLDFQNFTAIITGLSSFFQLRGAVIRDKLWLTNGHDPVQTFDGTTVTVLDGTNSTPNVPKGRYIAYHDERVWIGHTASARSECFFSALTDASANIIQPDNSAAWPNTNFLQISEGDADYLTGLLLYRGYLHFFKQYSIWRLVGFDEYTYTRVKTRASTGTRFNESLQILDSLIHMIGVDGLYVFDGEETERISDIIDPATAEQASFGFNQLQQPNTNNQFWEVTATVDFNSGTVPQNLAINNAATLQAKDNTKAAFQAASTLTNIDTTTVLNSIQLTVSNSGHSAINSALGQSGSLSVLNGVTTTIGQASFLTDGATNAGGSTNVGFQGGSGSTGAIGQFSVPVIAPKISRVILRQMSATSDTIIGFTGIPINITAVSPALGFTATTIDYQPAVFGRTDIIIDFTPMTISNFLMQFSVSGIPGFAVITEIEIYSTAFNSTGQIVSRSLYLGDTPASFGNFFSDFVANSENITFQTQSSNDGATWDAAVAVTNGGAIGSVVRPYLRWIGNFTSDGNYTPVLSDAWVGTLYESAIHDTGGNIFAWSVFDADYSLNGQTITFYYRGASTLAGVSSATWNLIVPGGAINMSTGNRYIQFKFEISGLSSGNNPPVVSSVTMNWSTGTAPQTSIFQNVASFFWRNRYWLAAAGPGATANNLVLIRGKKTFGSPWQLRDWPLLSFTRYLDNFYGTSSVDGSIYQLDTGYSKNGASLNSIFETGDFTFKGFQAKVVEIMVETERLGPYTLFVGHSTNQGQSWTDHKIDLTPVTGGTSSFWKRISNLNLTTDKIRLRFYINDVDKPWQVHNAIIYYQISNQRATVGVN